MQETNKKILIDVTPLTKIPLSRQQFFTYYFDRELPIGTLVSVPLFRSNIEGVVLASRPDFEHHGGFQLKKVAYVIEESFLTNSQLELAEKLSHHFLSPLGMLLKAFIPKRVKERSPENLSSIINHPREKIILTPEQQSAVEVISNTKCEIRNTKYLLHGPSSSGKTEVYIHSAIEIRKNDPSAQILVLLPEMTLTPQAIERYTKYFPPEEIALVHSGVSKGQFYTNWQKIKSGEVKLIIGTRMAVFAPFRKLGLIIVDEEQDMSFKQWDSSPRYDARKAAEFLSNIFACPLVFGTATPRVETYYKTSIGEYNLLELPKLRIPYPVSHIQDTRYEIQNTTMDLVDMRKEKWTSFDGKKKPNLSILSLKLQGEISYALSNNLQTILFVNHQGGSTFSVCANCKAVLKCPTCDRALVYDETGSYKCLHCKYSSGIIPNCKVCGGIEFKNIGVGTQSVEKEVKKLFYRARVRRLDTATLKKAGAQEQIYADFMDRKIDVLIGTQMITKGWDNPNVGLIGIVDADSLFTTPDFATDERAYANIMQVGGRTGRIGSVFPGCVIIQTFNPQREILQKIVSGESKSFYEKEIEQRQALKLPPFGKLIKLSFKDESKEKIEKEVQKVYAKISLIAAESDAFRITEPSDPLVSKIRGKFVKQMILKTGTDLESLPVELIKILAALGTGWGIDVDPISIA